jgi:hypothetical protein
MAHTARLLSGESLAPAAGWSEARNSTLVEFYIR